MNKQGHIQVILGPMFSGKTSTLMRLVKRFMIAKQECLVLYYAEDEIDTEGILSTHDEQHFKALKVRVLFSIFEMAKQYDVIAIDEGQFFDDLPDFCDQLAMLGKVVLVAALDGTFEKKQFNRVLELVPLAENVQKLTAVCYFCKSEDGGFTLRITNNKEIEMIGRQNYRPACRSCFEEHQS